MTIPARRRFIVHVRSSHAELFEGGFDVVHDLMNDALWMVGRIRSCTISDPTILAPDC